MPYGEGTGGGRKWWCRRFRGEGHRVTTARDSIMELLSKSKEHLSAEEIYLAIRSNRPDVGFTTVYRTLNLLTHMGLVVKYDFGDGRARYELSATSGGQKTHHHHLVCYKCGRIVDYTDFIDEELELLKKTEKVLSKKFNFKITDHLIQFYGLCETCAGGK